MLLLQQLTRAREKSVLKSRLTFGLTKIDVEYLVDVEYSVHLAKSFFEKSISVNLNVNLSLMIMAPAANTRARKIGFESRLTFGLTNRLTSKKNNWLILIQTSIGINRNVNHHQ